MPIFQIGQAIETTEPTVLVENKLAVGRHTFQLVVVDDAGNQSAPTKAIAVVVALPPPHPTGPGPIRQPILTRPGSPLRPGSPIIRRPV